MNIFEVLQYGKGSINEENISSFLGYLLNPNADHTLNCVFFKRFLKHINIKPAEYDAINTDKIEISFEYGVNKYIANKKQRRYIDILFETSEHTIAIENKVSESINTRTNLQLQDEYNGLLEQKEKPIIFCLLTAKKIKNVITPKLENDDRFIHIHWEDVINILVDILKDESVGKINPIDSHAKQTIKAFIYFMNSNKKNFKLFSLDNRKYRIFKFRDNSIALEQAIENEWTSVERGYKKNIIKKALLQYNIISQEEYNGISKNNTTYELGRCLFNSLKK